MIAAHPSCARRIEQQVQVRQYSGLDAEVELGPRRVPDGGEHETLGIDDEECGDLRAIRYRILKS